MLRGSARVDDRAFGAIVGSARAILVLRDVARFGSVCPEVEGLGCRRYERGWFGKGNKFRPSELVRT